MKERRVQFIKEQCTDRQFTLSILMDANELLGTKPEGIQKFTKTLQLTDIHPSSMLGPTCLGPMDRQFTSEARTTSTMPSSPPNFYLTSDAVASALFKMGRPLIIGGHMPTLHWAPCLAEISPQSNTQKVAKYR